MLAEFLVLAVLPLLLIAAGVWDLASYTIPNTLSLALAGAFLLFAFAAGLPVAGLADHLGAGLIGLTLGFALFAFGFIGGGDAKLFAAVLLWLGLRDSLPYALAASVMGGALTLLLVSLRRMPLPPQLAHRAWIARLHDPKGAVPYGVALAAGLFLILPQTEIFRLAAGL